MKVGPDLSHGSSTGMLAADAALLRGLAGLYFSYGRYAAAESLLDLVLWFDVGDTAARAMMARILVRQNRGHEAKSHISKARSGRANF